LLIFLSTPPVTSASLANVFPRPGFSLIVSPDVDVRAVLKAEAAVSLDDRFVVLAGDASDAVDVLGVYPDIAPISAA